MKKKSVFGSVAWQNMMEKTVARKLMKDKALNASEKAFIKVQREHNERLYKKLVEAM